MSAKKRLSLLLGSKHARSVHSRTFEFVQKESILQAISVHNARSHVVNRARTTLATVPTATVPVRQAFTAANAIGHVHRSLSGEIADISACATGAMRSDAMQW